ncbi:DUF5682 family protein [Blastococcus sp. SYSU D00922]
MTAATGTQAPEVRVLGVRHHGPGSARTVRAALEDFRPDVVLVEGPADADALVPLVTEEGMRPPVALLAYAADDPGVASFWPFAVFSPEWQALEWATAHGVPVRFCDLPAATVLADRAAAGEEDEPTSPDALEHQVRSDPIALLAEAAGFDDPERWWDDVVESRLTGEGPFEAIHEAMVELRANAPEAAPREQAREQRREAHMRSVLRGVLKEGRTRVAVVCGAWHTPALTAPLPPANADAAVLRGAPRRKVTLTWVPWTHGRLAAASGYGAGVASPGWYHHLFTAPDLPVHRWLTGVAGVLRGEDLPVSSAHVIEAVRLAETLAVLRGRPLAGLEEVTEATRAVLVEGDEVALDLVTRRVVVGEALGEVPESAPTVPLEADLRRQATTLRLKRDATAKTVELDLRRPNDLERSRLLHRLQLLGVPWGVPARAASRNLGTFREAWSLIWEPELSVALAEASVWGTTIAAAATARITGEARTGETSLPHLTSAVEACLLADLPDALPGLLGALDARAAVDTDVVHLMEALPALVRSLRYGDVRGTDTSALTDVAGALLVRICAGLPPALTGLDDDAAAVLRTRIDGVHAAVRLWDDEPATERWMSTLAGLGDRTDVHGLVTGRLVRLLLDGRRLDTAGAGARLSRALSVGTPPAAAAAWVEGFLSGGGTLLVHDADLLGLLDGWVTDLPGEAFTDVLPLLRRTFGSFEPPERRSIGDRVRRGPGRRQAPAADDEVDADLAAATLPTVRLLLGIPA